MKKGFMRLVLAIAIGVLSGISVMCEAGGICPSQSYSPMPHSYGCSAPLPKVNPAAPPQTSHGPRLVPLYVRDPGPVKPVVQCAVGLVGATLALPFRVAEMLCPLPQKNCGPTNACGPQQCIPRMPPSACYPPQLPPPCAPQACLRPVACAPVGPAVAPLPPGRCVPMCGPNLPPALVEEHQFPPLEPQNLLSGIWSFPGRLIRSGRLTGDIQNAPHTNLLSK